MFINVYLFVDSQMSIVRLAFTRYFFYSLFVIYYFFKYYFFISYQLIFLYIAICTFHIYFINYTNLYLEILEYIILNSVYIPHSNILLLRQSERNDKVNKLKPFNIKDILEMLPYCPCWYIPPWTINTYKCTNYLQYGELF